MSERGSSGGTPGNPPRIPGIPSNAHFHELAEWRTLNAQRPRPSIADQEMAWCQNLMPIGAYYLRAIPDHGTAIFGVPTPPFAAYAVSFGLIPASFDEVAVDVVSNGRILVPNPSPPPFRPLITDSAGTAGPITTTATNEIIVIWISADGPATGGSAIATPNVQSITGGGLVFQRRFQIQRTLNSSWNAYAPSIVADVEEWWAVAPSILTGVAFTVTFDAVVESAIFGLMTVKNANVSAPWDTSTSSAVNANNDSGTLSIVAVPALSTSGTNDIVFSWFAGYSNFWLWNYSYPVPWGTSLAGGPITDACGNWINTTSPGCPVNDVGDWNAGVGYYRRFTTPQSGITPYAFQGGGNVGTTNAPTWIGVADAIKGLPAVPYQPSFLRATGLGMPATATTFLYAAWIYIPGAVNGDSFTLIKDTATHSGIQLSMSLGGGVWTAHVTSWDSLGNNAAAGSVNVAADFRSGWHSLAFELDSSAEELYILVDGVSYTPSLALGSGLPFAMGASDTWEIGGSQLVAMNLGQMWFGVGQAFFDLSVLANQQALFGPTNCVTNWGDHGEAITGTQPQVFLFGPATFYPDNLGTGGAFTLTGDATFVDAGSVPPLCP